MFENHLGFCGFCMWFLFTSIDKKNKKQMTHTNTQNKLQEKQNPNQKTEMNWSIQSLTLDMLCNNNKNKWTIITAEA